MSKNLLKNPGFEQDWGDEQSHTTAVFPVDGDPRIENIPNIFAPPGWVPWFIHDAGRWDQPEVRAAPGGGDPDRADTGNQAILMFWFYRHGIGGYMQQVDVEPGTELRLDACAHAWSNIHDNPPYTDDPGWSEGAGYLNLRMFEGTAPDDETANFTFSIGIDPTGGVNPTASSVVWGRGAHIYNGYWSVPEVEVTTQASTITVFLRARCLWPYKHNDAYWDSIELLEVEDTPPLYEATVNVLPQDLELEDLISVVVERFHLRQTFMMSHDDAGRLCMEGRGTARLYNIERGDRTLFTEWYDQRYPGTMIEFLYTWGWFKLWQKDPLWANTLFGWPGHQTTLALEGCYLTAIAMAQRILEIDLDATPVSVVGAVGTYGYVDKTRRVLWAALRDGCGVDLSSSTSAQLHTHLESGGVALLKVDWTYGEHWVLGVRWLGDEDYLVLDPLYNEAVPLSNRYRGLLSWTLLSKRESPPQPPDPPDPPEPEPPGALRTHLIGPHAQTWVSGLDQFLFDYQPSVAKFFSVHDARWCEELSPYTLSVVRYYVGEQPLQGNLKEEARKYVEGALGDFEGVFIPNFMESWNEMRNSSSIESNKQANEFDWWFCEWLARSGFPVAPVICCTPVGNPLEDWVHLMIPVVKKACERGGAIGYHSYWWANPDPATDSKLESWFEWHAGRAILQWDPIFAAQDPPLKPFYISGEIGVVGSPDGHALGPYDGWRSPNCLGGNAARYESQLRRADELFAEWNLTHGGRWLGGTVFTTGEHFIGWGPFKMGEPEFVWWRTI